MGACTEWVVWESASVTYESGSVDAGGWPTGNTTVSIDTFEYEGNITIEICSDGSSRPIHDGSCGDVGCIPCPDCGDDGGGGGGV